MGRMAGIHALRMIKAMVRLGWTVARVAGSHHILTRTGHSSVTIPVKKGATLKEGTAKSILSQAGVSEDEFFDAY
jgi:predicted RNA binding protein YcfA (HicA-like mRNA interferase family)